MPDREWNGRSILRAIERGPDETEDRLRRAIKDDPDVSRAVIRLCSTVNDNPYDPGLYARWLAHARQNEQAKWHDLLLSAARLQREVPGSVLVGGTAVALLAGHRYSTDADHVVTDLKDRYDQAHRHQESLEGWSTAHTSRLPITILGSLDGQLAGVRQLKRPVPLETQVVEYAGHALHIPTYGELLRIRSQMVYKPAPLIWIICSILRGSSRMEVLPRWGAQALAKRPLPTLPTPPNATLSTPWCRGGGRLRDWRRRRRGGRGWCGQEAIVLAARAYGALAARDLLYTDGDVQVLIIA